ncbi:MAG TPA: FAD-dependent monooxygenase, partial [Acidimicrobiia bacterium]|nr:FAD-dependent monooxygenase [Acidimicrobiia bacterium]
DGERATGQLERRIRAVIGDVDYEIDWLSTYRFHQRVVDRFRVGNVFFAGDAAHALPPYGARGMNSGIQDADNLAWKLAAVIGGRATDALLDSYHDERHAAAGENLAVSEATIRFMVPATRRARLARNTLLRLAPGVKGLRRRVNSGRMAEPFTYSMSPIVDPADAGGLVGAFAPDGLVSARGGARRLRELLGQGFVVLHAGTDPDAARQFAEEVVAQNLPLRLLTLLPSGADADALPAESGALHDASGLLGGYAPGGEARWYLIRPDGHIAASRHPAEVDQLPAIFLRCSGSVDASPRAYPVAPLPRDPATAGEGARP